MALDLEAIEARDEAVYAGRSLNGRPFVLSTAEEDRHALLAENRRLREALGRCAALTAHDQKTTRPEAFASLNRIAGTVASALGVGRAAEVLK